MLALVDLEADLARPHLEPLDEVLVDVGAGDRGAGLQPEVDLDAPPVRVRGEQVPDLAGRGVVEPRPAAAPDGWFLEFDSLIIMLRSSNESQGERFLPRRPPSGTDNFGNLFRDTTLAVQQLVAEELARRGFADLRPALLAVGQHVGADGTRITELAARAWLTKATVVHAVDELERLGYVTREPDPTDGRAKLVMRPPAPGGRAGRARGDRRDSRRLGRAPRRGGDGRARGRAAPPARGPLAGLASAAGRRRRRGRRGLVLLDVLVERAAVDCAVDGHQILSPISSTAAGTMIVRTMNVSSRIPSATMKPRSNVNVTGSVIRTEKVPARMIPALVITGPVAASARSIPSRVPWRRASSRTRAIRKIV